MWDTSARLLRLLSLFQSRPEWTGAELAERLDVTRRTVRRDIARLRDLDYPIQASQGAAGYRLGTATGLPPLLLDDDEAVAVAVGLRSATGGSVEGIEEASLRALRKLEQILPSRLRHQVQALHSVTVPMTTDGPTVTPELLTAIAAASRDRRCLRFDYLAHDGTRSLRTVEPHRVVHTGRRWYLIGWDRDREDWRTFRVDRITPRIPGGPRFVPRELPEDDVAAYTARGISNAAYRHHGVFTLEMSLEAAAEHIGPTVGVLEAVDVGRCRLRTGSDSLGELLLYVATMGCEFQVEEPLELVQYVERVRGRLGRSVVGLAC